MYGRQSREKGDATHSSRDPFDRSLLSAVVRGEFDLLESSLDTRTYDHSSMGPFKDDADDLENGGVDADV